MAFSLEPTEITQIVRLVAIMYVLRYKVTICRQKAVICKTKHLGCKKKCEAKKNQRLKALISNKGMKSVNESAT